MLLVVNYLRKLIESTGLLEAQDTSLFPNTKDKTGTQRTINLGGQIKVTGDLHLFAMLPFMSPIYLMLLYGY